MIKFSIIVPVYNVEKYVGECIESVINQDFNNYELILINDGSKDNSGKICDSYQQKNNNIKVIHMTNGRVSNARNKGLHVANGEYIIFLDADDILNVNCLNIINGFLNKEKVDILSCDYNIYEHPVKKKDICLKKIEKIEDFLNNTYDIPWAVWRNVYKRKILLDNKIEFDEGVGMAEDCNFFMEFFENTTQRRYSNIDIISYRNKRIGSATNTVKYKTIMDQFEVFSKYFYIYFKQNNKKMYELFANKYLNVISTIGNINSKDELKNIYNHIKRNKIILKNSNGKKYIIAKIIWLLFGYRLGSKILSFH